MFRETINGYRFFTGYCETRKSRGEKMTPKTPLFQSETNGYCRQQVDAVWAKLEEQYKDLYAQWKALSEQNASITQEASSLRAANVQLAADVKGKTLENEGLAQRIKELEASSRAVAKSQSSPIMKELMDIVLRHATEIISDAKEEAGTITQRAQAELAARREQAASAYAGFQPARVS
jgi:cell division septum initiation protein DivIVA